MIPGLADVHVIWRADDGRPVVVHLEVKRPGAMASPAQIAVARKAVGAGAEWFQVHSPRAAIEALRRSGIRLDHRDYEVPPGDPDDGPFSIGDIDPKGSPT